MHAPILTSLLLAAALLAGCSPDPPAPKKEETPAAIPGQEAATRPALPATIQRPKVPDDLFFKEPLAIAAIGAQDRAVKPPEATPTTPDKTPGTPSPGQPTAGAPVDWAALLPADALAAEVTRIRERFAPNLQNVAAFNNSLLDFPPYAAELAALAGIATQHPGDIPWKANAKFIRDLAGQMNAEELQRGQKSYDQVKKPFDKLALLLDGKKADDLPESTDPTDFSAVADFGFLMKRLEAGQNLLKNTGGTAAALKQNAADLARETRVAAAVSQVIQGEGYGYADDAKFRGFAAAMTKASLDAAAAAESGDFAKFDLAASALGQSCVKCHADYRNN